jgi:hypothetical protein
VLADAAGIDLHDFRRYAAERDQQFAMLLQRYPRRLLCPHYIHVHEDARQQRSRSTEAVRSQMGDITAKAIHEAVHLALRMMKTSRARPAVRSREYRAVAELRGDTLDFRRGNVECLIPRHIDESLRAALFPSRTGAAFEITFANRRLAHTHRSGDRMQ